MNFQKLYQRFLYPFQITSFLIIVFLGIMGVKNLVGAVSLPAIEPTKADLQDTIRVIAPVRKKILLAGNQEVKVGANPFTPDHNDWEVTKSKNEKRASRLKLEIEGIVVIKNKKKVLIRDMDSNGKSMWLSEGDRYKQYRVAYIDKRHVVFTSKELSLLFTLKKTHGTLYSGEGQIIIAPDIDLYLQKLAEEDGHPMTQKTKVTEKDKSHTAKRGDSRVNATRKHTAGGRFGEKENGQHPDSVNVSPATNTTKYSDSSSPAPSSGASSPSSVSYSKEDELNFILELKKIFQQNSK